MFLPTSARGQIFRKYLLMFAHPAKIRIQNITGKFFSKGISIKNEENVLFTLDANDWITRIILLEGDYESGSTKLAKKVLSSGGLFMDVGANFGLFTCIAAVGNDKIKIIAVEPNHRVMHRLLHNISQNGLEERVQVMNVAVSGKFQFVTMEQPASNNMGTTTTREGSAGLLSVLSCPLDFICSENNIRKVTLLKIDVEGNEFDILKEFPFEKYRVENIILEFNHLSKVPFYELWSFFERKGFKAFTITGEELVDEKKGIPENNIWLVNQY
jgi:FkbM family methyltransferase